MSLFWKDFVDTMIQCWTKSSRMLKKTVLSLPIHVQVYLTHQTRINVSFVLYNFNVVYWYSCVDRSYGHPPANLQSSGPISCQSSGLSWWRFLCAWDFGTGYWTAVTRSEKMLYSAPVYCFHQPRGSGRFPGCDCWRGYTSTGLSQTRGPSLFSPSSRVASSSPCWIWLVGKPSNRLT